MNNPEGTTPERVQRTYLSLILLQTLAASLIWGVNTLFLLDAGLSITEAFVANAAFTAGMMIFEVPTGVIADAWGRRASFLLGAGTLLVSTVAYLGLWYIDAGIGWWIVTSAFIGLGFTFFSGATEAWLVDALTATGYSGAIEEVFGKGQTAVGFATLLGTIGGGFLAQISLGVPYIARSVLLFALIVAAYLWMHDIGYTPVRGASVRAAVTHIVSASVEHGWRNRPVRLFMLAAPFATGVGIWVFYAFQPYVLELFGDPEAVYLSGIAAAVYAVAQMIGGASVNWARRRFETRTAVILSQIAFGAFGLVIVGLAEWFDVPIGFWVAITFLGGIALSGSIAAPMQQAYMNEVIPSAQRATVLSFSSLMGSAGGVVIQPALGKVADVYSLGIGYIVAGIISLIQFPYIWAVRRLGRSADRVAKPVSAAPPEDLAR
ncbi:MAG TPA: MFS transporter [Acidimicrobiia bacterium]|nr:MFS transporter [Acidimicrobiia bacterium]